jgi:mono/diheme cytochrome c family protein
MKYSLKLMPYVVWVAILSLVLTACGSAAATPTKAPVVPTSAPAAATTAPSTEEIARPSNSGGPGPALALTGDPVAGKQIFVDNCQKCHGENGVGGVENPGSDDGTIPELNPIDETMVSADMKVFAYNVDLFVEHGSTAPGTNVKEKMPAWGDEKKLTAQQIADVIAYVMSLNMK